MPSEPNSDTWESAVAKRILDEFCENRRAARIVQQAVSRANQRIEIAQFCPVIGVDGRCPLIRLGEVAEQKSARIVLPIPNRELTSTLRLRRNRKPHVGQQFRPKEERTNRRPPILYFL